MSTLKRKKNRKSKKSSSLLVDINATNNNTIKPVNSSPLACFNKENIQVKALLLNEYKRNGVTAASATRFITNSLESLCNNNNKKQLRRANKNALFVSNKSLVNKKQRKYHMLQQPASTSSSSNMQF